MGVQRGVRRPDSATPVAAAHDTPQHTHMPQHHHPLVANQTKQGPMDGTHPPVAMITASASITRLSVSSRKGGPFTRSTCARQMNIAVGVYWFVPLF